MNTQTVTETGPIAQEALSPEDHFQLAAEHFYAYLRSAAMPPWERLTARQRTHVENALLVGARSPWAEYVRKGRS